MPVRAPERPRPSTREEALETQLKLARAQNAYLHRELATALKQGPLAPYAVESVLRQLLTLAHPDKWSQGQPATELAHELTTTINALRDRLHAQTPSLWR